MMRPCVRVAHGLFIFELSRFAKQARIAASFDRNARRSSRDRWLRFLSFSHEVLRDRKVTAPFFERAGFSPPLKEICHVRIQFLLGELRLLVRRHSGYGLWRGFLESQPAHVRLIAHVREASKLLGGTAPSTGSRATWLESLQLCNCRVEGFCPLR